MAYTTIDKPDEYFNTVLYTGNGSTLSIGLEFSPDYRFGLKIETLFQTMFYLILLEELTLTLESESTA
jgi:hypothetical protein